MVRGDEQEDGIKVQNKVFFREIRFAHEKIKN